MDKCDAIKVIKLMNHIIKNCTVYKGKTKVANWLKMDAKRKPNCSKEENLLLVQSNGRM